MRSEPDYSQLFESSPVLSILVNRNFRIAGRATLPSRQQMTTRGGGEGALEVFPSDPRRPEASGERVVRELLGRLWTSLLSSSFSA
jgi:hypothetical protein